MTTRGLAVSVRRDLQGTDRLATCYGGEENRLTTHGLGRGDAVDVGMSRLTAPPQGHSRLTNPSIRRPVDHCEYLARCQQGWTG